MKSYQPLGGSSKSTRPDFLVSKDGKDLFYVECTLAANRRISEAQQRQLDQLNEYIDKRLASDDFYIGVEVSEAPSKQLPLKDLKSFLEDQLEGLDPEVVASEELQMSEDPYEWTWSNGEWRVVFWPILKQPEARGNTDGRSIGMGVYSPESVNPEVPLQQALKDKAGGKYGAFALPYVIAVGAMDEFTNVEDVKDALVGPLHVYFDSESKQTISRHKPDDGTLWLGQDLEPKNRRVSAVIVTVRAKAINLASSKLLGMFHNPWALRPLNCGNWRGSSYSLNTTSRKIDKASGQELWDILGVRPPD